MEKFIYKKSAGITALSASFSDFQYKKHCHEEYALGVTLRGVQQYNMDGSLQSSYRDGVMLFNPEQVHDGRSQDKTGIDYVMVYIEPSLFLEMVEKRERVRFLSPIVYNHRLEQSILNLTHAMFNDSDESLCSELLLALGENVADVEMGRVSGKNNGFVSRAKEMIYFNLDQVLRLDDLCQEFGMSKFQFIRAFKANTGISPYQFYLNCKVERARLLIERNKDIYSAVTECGFVDLTHLNRHFKSKYGITAYEYSSHIT